MAKSFRCVYRNGVGNYNTKRHFLFKYQGLHYSLVYKNKKMSEKRVKWLNFGIRLWYKKFNYAFKNIY